jgi:Spherulation-specific family 4/Protein kinase domain
MIHRDLKPANILLQGGTPRIADFGLAQLKHPDFHWSDIAGTPMYMAPEAFDGCKDNWTDLWSVGVLLYQMLLGRLPFQTPDDIRHRDYAPIPTTLPYSLRLVMDRTFQKDRLARYPSADAMRLALRRAFSAPVEEASFAVPAYFYPGSHWVTMLDGAPRVAIAIINPDSGPGMQADDQYVLTREMAQQKGVTIVGYVHSIYGRRPIEEVCREIDTYKQWYSVDGIFIDQVPTESSQIDYYRRVVGHIRARPGALTILNPGTFPDEAYAKLGDILCVFDGSHSDHSVRQIPEWIFGYPATKFWHIVYDTPNASAMKKTLAIARRNNAGYVYITDGRLPNPFDRLPSYWVDEISIS